jgi:hypothetical protein
MANPELSGSENDVFSDDPDPDQAKIFGSDRIWIYQGVTKSCPRTYMNQNAGGGGGGVLCGFSQ